MKSELVQTAVTHPRGVAPQDRKIAVTLTAGEWEELFLNQNRSRSLAGDEIARHAEISLRTQLAKEGLF